MKVLFFTHHYLDDNSGGSFASRAYINAFTEIADSCLLMYPDRGIPVSDFIHKKCILIGVKYEKSNLGKVIDYYRGRLHRYMDVMIPQIDEFNPDIVVFDNSRTSGGMLKKIIKPGLKIITIHHNYEMEYYKGTKPFIAWRFPFLYFMEEAERTSVQFSDLNLTLTDEDLKLLQIHYDPHKTSKIEKIGCFESVSSIKPVDNKNGNMDKSSNSDFLFVITGALGTYQTEVSVIPFLENEYQELLKMLPESKLIIAGRDPSDKMKKVCSKYPSVKIIPNPENMQEIIAKADIYICPTCVGGGLKLRVMDGLKAGLPVITHAISARGYSDFSKAECMFIYDTKDTFMLNLEKVIQEIKNGNLASSKIKSLYDSYFSFDSGVKRLKEILFRFEII